MLLQRLDSTATLALAIECFDDIWSFCVWKRDQERPEMPHEAQVAIVCISASALGGVRSYTMLQTEL